MLESLTLFTGQLILLIIITFILAMLITGLWQGTKIYRDNHKRLIKFNNMRKAIHEKSRRYN